MPRFLSRRAACLAGAGLSLLLAACGGHFQDVPSTPPPVQEPRFADLMAATARAPWVGGNDVRTLENGDAYFPVMLKAIERARHTITFETFVFKQGQVGRDFSLSFARAARRGVKVHVLLDANGSRWVNDDDVTHMRRAGVELHFYRPFNPLRPDRYNARTHRKTMVVDGEVAYTGGAGYTNLWAGDARHPHEWRDTQYEIRGPVVRQVQAGFNDNWEEVTGTRLDGPDYFPPLTSVGPALAQFSLGSPGKAGDTLGSSFLLAINAARHSILIEHSYFIPHRVLLEALLRARERGVAVTVIVCGEHTDFQICRIAQRPALRELARAGAEIWEYTPTMMHGKLLVVDDYFSAVGSANFDDRSFFINDEANLHVLDSSFASDQRAMFERDRQRCRRLTERDLRLRPLQLPLHLGSQLIKGQL